NIDQTQYKLITAVIKSFKIRSSKWALASSTQKPSGRAAVPTGNSAPSNKTKRRGIAADDGDEQRKREPVWGQNRDASLLANWPGPPSNATCSRRACFARY